MRMRKMIALAMALTVICGGAAPLAAEMPEYTLTANAVDVVDSGKCGDNLTWEIDSEGTLTISGTGEMYGLPLQFDQYSDALWYDSTTVKRSDIKNVIINEGVINVGAAAFYRCSNLKKANLPNGLVSIDYAAFGGSGLEEINIPDSLESIGSRDTYIEGGVGTIGDGAFDGTPWLEEKIKENKIVVVNNCLIYCYGWGYFSPVTVEDGDESYKRVVIPDGVKVIAEYVFGVPHFLGTPVEDITIPGSLKSINYSMFGSSLFRNVTIKNGVERIEDRAFVECVLKEVTIPESVRYIGYHAFGPHEANICWDDESWGEETPIELKKITILNPNCELNQIIETDSESPERYRGVICGYEGSTAQKFATEHDLAFESLGEYQPETTTTAKPATTTATTTTTAKPATTTTKAATAKPTTTATKTTTANPATTTTKATTAKPTTTIKETTTPKPATTTTPTTTAAAGIVDSGKCGDNLIWEIDSEGTLTISGTGEMYDNYTTNDSKYWSDSNIAKKSDIKTVIINDGVTSVGSASFFECENLSKVVLPDSLVSIGYASFARSGLEEINIPASVKECCVSTVVEVTSGIIAFDDTPWLEAQREKNPLVIVNNIVIDARKCEGDIIIPDNVERIDDYAFMYAGEKEPLLNSVTIPGSVKTISGNSFLWCGLQKLVIENGVERIDDGAFHGCFNLSEVIISESVECIRNAFLNCSELKKFTVLNPECELENLFSLAGAPEGSVFYDGVICGYEGSTAQKFATEHDLAFESLGATPTNTATESGDLNDDGKIDANDATLVLVNYSLLSTGEKMQLTESQQKAADVNGDGKIDASDATMILQYYSYLSTGGDLVFKEFMKQNG